MRCIGQMGNIDIFVPTDAYLSLFNSPYIGHIKGSALDVYPAHEEWDGPAKSPVSGKVTHIHRIRMGKKGEFFTNEFDYAIGITPLGREDEIVRVLHCHPTVDIGQVVEIGDEIGSLLRSRYFNFWTGPHYHLEAMQAQFFKRSSQSFLFGSMKPMEPNLMVYIGTCLFDSSWIIERVTDDYILLASKDAEFGSVNGYFGHLAHLGESQKALLDMGFPHYHYGGLYGLDSPSVGKVRIGDVTIGSNAEAHRGVVQFRTYQTRQILLNNERVRGISTYLYSSRQLVKGKPLLKIIPLQYPAYTFHVSEGEHVSFTVS